MHIFPFLEEGSDYRMDDEFLRRQHEAVKIIQRGHHERLRWQHKHCEAIV